MADKSDSSVGRDDRASDAEGSGLLGTLMAHWIHEDQLVWGRTQTILVLQAGVLGGAYSLYDKSRELYAFILLVFGAVVTSVFFVMMEHHRRTRNINVELMVKIGRRLSLPYSDAETPCFRLSAPAPYSRLFRGRTLLMLIVCFLVAIDVLGALLVLHCWLGKAATL